MGDARHIRDDFVSVVTHELRTPLTAVQGGAAVLRQHWRDLPAETIEELLASIERQATRMNALVTHLLELSRLDRGVLRMELAPVAVREVAESAVERAASNGASVEVEVEVEGDVVVSADGARLRQMVEELVDNAAGSGASHIAVRASARGDQVDVAVVDDGPGVPDQLVPDLFERFVRGDTGEPGGWGLGLALVRELAQAQGGQVRYRPNAPSGACFTLTLGTAR